MEEREDDGLTWIERKIRFSIQDDKKFDTYIPTDILDMSHSISPDLIPPQLSDMFHSTPLSTCLIPPFSDMFHSTPVRHV